MSRELEVGLQGDYVDCENNAGEKSDIKIKLSLRALDNTRST